MKNYKWTKARIFRWCLGISGWVFCLIMAFVIEQYYRWEVCNFVARDGESHTYNIYEGTIEMADWTLVRLLPPLGEE